MGSSTSSGVTSQTSTASPSVSRAVTGPVALLVGTRKGAFILRSDSTRNTWKLEGPHFLGCIVYHLVADPRDGQTLLMATRTGHLGPTVFRSTDFGKTWQEATKPPAFPKAAEGQKGPAVDQILWLTPGHPTEPNVWYAGTAPAGLFRSEDGGATWEGVSGFNQHPNWRVWAGDEQISPPGFTGTVVHSVLIDPRDPKHMYLSISVGGTLESTDQGADWKPINRGLRADWPLEDPEWGYDPHCVRLHPLMPHRLYQQNHCGIYRMERADGQWIRIGEAMPKEIGDIGFPIVLHPRDPDIAWVFPMDGTSVWPRVSPEGKPAVYVTRDAGGSWQRQDRGMPQEQAWFTVKRQGMTVDQHDPVGVYFGTTNGEVWASRDEGATWACLVTRLPEIFAVEAAEVSS